MTFNQPHRQSLQGPPRDGEFALLAAFFVVGALAQLVLFLTDERAVELFWRRLPW